MGARWRHLANTTEPSMCGGDAALCQITYILPIQSFGRVLKKLNQLNLTQQKHTYTKKLHRVSKNYPPLACYNCYNFNTCKRILIFFGRNVTDKVSNQKTPPQITCASALAGKTGKYENRIFPSTAALVHCLNSTSCLTASIFLTHDSYSRCCMTP